MTFRRVALYASLLTIALIAGTWLVVTRPGVARWWVLESLGDLFTANLQIENAKVDPIGGEVQIDNMRLTPRAVDGRGRRDKLKVRRLTVGLSLNPLDAGQIQTVTIEKPEFDIFLGADTPFDVGSLLRLGGNDTPGHIPSMRIKDMTVRLHLPSDKDLVLVLGPIQLSVLPDATEPTRLALKGECPNPLGGVIKIHGTGDVENGEFRLLAEADEFRLRANGMEAFGAEVARFVRERRLTGLVKPLLWLTYPDATGKLGGGIRTRFSNLQVRPPTFTYLLTHLAGNASITSDNGGTLNLSVDRSGTDFELSGSVRLENLIGDQRLTLRAHAENVQINRKLAEALARIPEARKVFDALRPANGRGDIDVFLRFGGPDNGEPRTQLDLDLRGLDFRYEGFVTRGKRIGCPYPFTNGHGRVEVRDRFVTIHSMCADGVAGGKIEIRGKLDLARHDIDLTIEGKDFPLGAEVRPALDRLLRENVKTYDSFAPRGSTDYTVSLQQRSGDDGPTWEATLRPRSASATWERFPFRIDNIVGQIRLMPGEVRFQLEGRRLGTASVDKITARARFYGGAGIDEDQRTTEIRVTSEKATFSPELKTALTTLEPKLGEQWELLSPRGKFDLELLAWTPPGSDDLSFDLRGDLHHARARFASFPVELRELNGPVIVHGDGKHTRVEVLGLRSRALEARLLFQGALDFAGEHDAPTADLMVVANDVRLNDKLSEVLVEQKLITKELWQRLAATGTVNTFLSIKRKPTDPDYLSALTVDLRQVTSKAALLPDTLTRMSGEVRIDEKRVIWVKDLEGYLGDSHVTCEEGRISQDKDATNIALTLSADRYPVDDRLASLLTEELKQAYLARRAHGHVTVADLLMTLRLPRAPRDGSKGLGISGRLLGARVRAENLALEAGVQVSGLTGYAVIDEGTFGPEGAIVKGRAAGLSFVTLGQQFSDARGPFVATPRSFTVQTGDIRIHGGALRSVEARAGNVAPPLVHLTLDESSRLEVSLAIARVNLAELLDSFDTLQTYSGLVDGHLDLKVNIDDPTTLEMDAEIAISDGYLGDIPVFRSIYAMLRPENQPNFDSGSIKLHAQDRVVKIERWALHAPVVKVQGKGSLRFDGLLALTIEFPDLFPEASRLVVLPWIVRRVASSLVSHKIEGYVGSTRSGTRFAPLKDQSTQRPLSPLPGRQRLLPRIYR